MKIRILTTCLKSGSAKRIAQGLSTKLQYKVWRSSKVVPNRQHLRYGDQKGKIEQYQWFKEQKLEALSFTQSRDEAQQWAEHSPVVCRTLTHVRNLDRLVRLGDAGQRRL